MDADAPLIVVTAGLLGSASTWAFNATVELLHATTGGEIGAFFSDEIHARDEAELNQAAATVIKCHAPQPSLRVLIRLARLPVIVTVRDPCDAVVSVMQRFDLDFDEALARVELSARSLVTLPTGPTYLVLRYEDRFTTGAKGIKAIAAHLKLAPPPIVIRDLTRQLSRRSIARLLKDIDKADAPVGSAWQRRHQWHRNHLGDGRIGKYRKFLSHEQAAQIQRATQEFRRKFLYARPPVSRVPSDQSAFRA